MWVIYKPKPSTILIIYHHDCVDYGEDTVCYFKCTKILNKKFTLGCHAIRILFIV